MTTPVVHPEVAVTEGRSKRPRLSAFVKLVIGAVVIVIIMWRLGISPAGLAADLKRISLSKLLFLLLPLLALDRWIMAFKWNLLLRAVAVNIDHWRAFRVYMASGFLGLAVPFSIGADATRTYVLSRVEGGLSRIAVTVLVERILGMVAICILVLILAPILAWHIPELRHVGILAGSAAAALSAGVLLAFNVDLRELLERKASGRVGSRVVTVAAKLHDAWMLLRGRPDVLARFLALSVLESLVPVLLAVIIASELDMTVPWWMHALIVPVVLLLIRLPVAFSGIGLIEVSYVYLYSVAGAESREGFSLGLVMDVLGLALPLAGVFFLFSRDIRFQKSL